MLQLSGINLDLDEAEDVLSRKIAACLDIPIDTVRDVKVVRKSIDARKKPVIKRVYTAVFSTPDEAGLLSSRHDDQRLSLYRPAEPPPLKRVGQTRRILVVGMGPGGLFAALRLAEQGFAVSLVDRGEPVEERVKKVEAFWRHGELDPDSNVQFGEGGAGTFSDGKLTTRVRSPWNRYVLQAFIDCGAPDDILVEANPHLGTDVLRRVLIGFRKRLQAAGVKTLFRSCLTGLDAKNGRIRAGILNGDEEVPADAVVLAPGHSARDTYAMLARSGFGMEQKPFAVGFRVEHPAGLINKIQYGLEAHPNLPAADYSLRYNDAETGRGVYSFCMCPGGEVITASSEAGGVVVNGMSSRSRDRTFSNSALVASVGPADFKGDDPLAGVRFQRHWERAAYRAAGSGYRAPAQNLLAFLGTGQGPVRSTCRPGITETELSELLPHEVIAALHRGVPNFNRRMKGFVSSEAVLIGVETRTSAPVRILRDEKGESVSHPGLYPCGEGAGYAGGIMSAALDGIRTAEHIINRIESGAAREANVC